MSYNRLVSVVIPAYNREKTIERAIDSVLSQTYQEIECIVVDDCSTDDTERIVSNRYGADPRVRYHKLEKNSGACVARNKGVEISKGNYVAFLDSDDLYLPNKIEIQIKAIEKSGAQFCATGFIGKSRTGETSIRLPYHGSKEDTLNELLYLNFVTTGVLCGLRRCLLETPFDPQQPRYQDWDIVLRLYKKYDFIFVDDPTLELIYQPNSISSTTSHEKTLRALIMLYGKNAEDYSNNPRANTQIHWLIGLHSMFVPGEKDTRSLWVGVMGNGFSLRRFFVFIAIQMGFTRLFAEKIQHI